MRVLPLMPLILALSWVACSGSGGAHDAREVALPDSDATVIFDALETASDTGEVALCRDRFHVPIPSYGPARTPVVNADGTLLVVSGELLIGLSSEGLERFRRTIEPGAVLGTPALHGDALLVGSNSGALYRLDPDDGEIRWQKQLDTPISHAPVRVGASFVAAGRAGLYWIGEESPSKAFVTKNLPLDTPPTQPIVIGDAVIATSGTSLVVRDAAAQGEDRSLMPAGTGALTSQAVPLDDARVLIGATWTEEQAPVRGLIVYGLDAGTNKRVAIPGLLAGPDALLVRRAGESPDVWGFTAGGEGFRTDLGTGGATRFVLGGTPYGHPLLADDGTWYVAVAMGTDEVRLYARDLGADGGAVRWSTRLTGSRPGGVALGKGGTLLFPVGLDLHGYRCGSSALADAPWPKFQRDPFHTGGL